MTTEEKRQFDRDRQAFYRERRRQDAAAGRCRCGSGQQALHPLSDGGKGCSQCLQDDLSAGLARLTPHERAALASNPAAEQAARAGGAPVQSWNPFDAAASPGVETGTWSLGEGKIVWDKEAEEARRARAAEAAIPPYRRPVPCVYVGDDPMYSGMDDERAFLEAEKTRQDALGTIADNEVTP